MAVLRNPVLTNAAAAAVKQRRIAELQDLICQDEYYTRNARQLVANIATGKVDKRTGKLVFTALKSEALRRAGISLAESRRVIKVI